MVARSGIKSLMKSVIFKFKVQCWARYLRYRRRNRLECSICCRGLWQERAADHCYCTRNEFFYPGFLALLPVIKG